MWPEEQSGCGSRRNYDGPASGRSRSNTPQMAWVGEVRSISQSANIGVTPSLKGPGVSCRIFWEVGLPAIESGFPEHIDRIAAAIIPGGRSHSSGEATGEQPGCQVFLTDADFAQIGVELQRAVDGLPVDLAGEGCSRSASQVARVFSIDAFFAEKTRNGHYHGFPHAPKSPLEWLQLSEDSLFDIANAQVFYDPLGEFSARRQGFAAYYPDDVWRKRLSDALLTCGENGQRLLPTALAGHDYYTAQIAWWSFSESAMRLGFLLNRRYAPSRDRLYREFCMLPELSFDIINWLWEGQCDTTDRIDLVGLIASACDDRLIELGLCSGGSDRGVASFKAQSEAVAASIADPEVARFG